MNDAPTAFIDLRAQRRWLGSRLGEAIERVLTHGAFIMGPEIRELEEKHSAISSRFPP